MNSRPRLIPSSAAQRGNTFVGLIVGLLVGLFIAVAVAIYINKTPVPFVSKSRVDHPMVDAKDASQAPDPNRPLYGKDVQQNESKVTTIETTPAAPGSPEAAPGQPAPGKAGQEPAKTGVPVIERSDATKVAKAEPQGAPAVAPADERSNYFLQAGAFRDSGDADGMKAKLAMMGFDVKVTQAEVNGNTVYRVRLGPYGKLDDMNRVRAKLAENGVEASVVKIKQP